MEIIRAENVYTQSGANAIRRTIGERAKEIRSYFDFDGASWAARVNNAIQAMPSTGAVLDMRGLEGTLATAETVVVDRPLVLLVGNTILESSASPIFSVASDVYEFVLEGIGFGATTIRQTAGNNGFNLLPISTMACHFSKFTLDGDDAGAIAINTNHLQDSVFERLNIVGWLSHGIVGDSSNSLHVEIAKCRFTAGVGAAKTASAVRVMNGTTWRLYNNYFNIGGTVASKTITGATNATPIEITTSTAHGYSNGDIVTIVEVVGNFAANGRYAVTSTGANTFTLDGSVGNGTYVSGGRAQTTNRYTDAVNLTGHANGYCNGNIYEGVVNGVLVNSSFESECEYFETHTGGFGFGVCTTANNPVKVSQPRSLPIERVVDFHGVQRKYVTITGCNDRGLIGGTLLSAIARPAQLTGNVDNYHPYDVTDTNVSGLLYDTWRLTSDAAGREISGIVAGVDGQQLRLINAGSYAIRLKAQSGASAAGNRLLTQDTLNAYIRASEVVDLMYDATDSRWRILTPNPWSPSARNALATQSITANQNNYAPAGAELTHWWPISTDASRTITGINWAALVADQGSPAISGYELIISNVGSFDLVLADASGSSDADKQIRTGTGANITLTPNQSKLLVYDATLVKWRVI